MAVPMARPAMRIAIGYAQRVNLNLSRALTHKSQDRRGPLPEDESRSVRAEHAGRCSQSATAAHIPQIAGVTIEGTR